MLVTPVLISNTAAAPPAGNFAQESFAGSANADLTTLTATIGGAWSNLITSGTGAILIDGVGGCFVNPFGSIQNPVYSLLSATPPSADYSTEFVAHFISGSRQMGIASRIVDVSNYWYLNIDVSSINLGRVIAGVDAGGGTFGYDITLGGNNDPIIVMQHVGNDHYAFLNGVQKIHVVSSQLPGAGTVGVLSFGNSQSASTGLHVQSFRAYP